MESMQILKPTKISLQSSGVVSYNESVRCRNIIRLKKEIRNRFAEFSINKIIYYELQYIEDNQEFETKIKEILAKNQEKPFLLYFHTKN